MNTIQPFHKEFPLSDYHGILPVAPVSVRENIPLSFAQLRLWMLAQMEPDIPNNVVFTIRIRGPLILELLQKSLDTILERHGILRTTYYTSGGDPVQKINTERTVRIIGKDLCGLSEEEQMAEVQRLTAEEAGHLFNLSEDMMLRTALLKLSGTDHVLLLTMHHIASDPPSIEIFYRELLALYTAYAGGNPPSLAALPVQYADFAIWRRQIMEGEVLEPQLSYWKKQLADIPSALDLPSDHPRPLIRSHRGSSHSIILPGAVAESIRQMSEDEGVSLFTVMMATFKTLLYRYTGQGDLCVGTFSPNRYRPEIRGLIGFFVNALVLRTDLSDGPVFRELLRREEAAVQGALDHYNMPFEKLVEVLNPQRDPARTPLFQVALVFDDMPADPVQLQDLSFELTIPETTVSLYDLMLVITVLPAGMKLSFVYWTDLFDLSSIQRLAENFRTLLDSVLLHPGESIFRLPILAGAESSQILFEWSGSGSIVPADRCIHEMFEARVEQTPDSVAVVFENSQMTYRELNSMANQLAHYLIKQGAGQEVLIGICLERSLEMIAGLLAILKAGGVYVPLDPDYPRGRLQMMMEDAAVSVLLTHSRLAERIPLNKEKIVCVDSDRVKIMLESRENPISAAGPENAACLLYTSGSTGIPKGVVIQHAAVNNFIGAVISRYGLLSSDRIQQYASISFDASIEEIFPCLCIGATLVLGKKELFTNSNYLEKCQEKGLTVISLPTAFWHTLIQDMETEDLRIPSSVRLVVIGGEKALPDRLCQWQRHVGLQVRLLNSYGPTEATVVSTIFDMTHFNPETLPGKELPIGRPLPGVRTYILDTQLQPVPAGVAGELYIGGSNLAREYLKRPEVTAEKFIPDPFGEPGTRLYRTGDIVRYLSDGNIEYLGRIDHQVKIRGFRIELGEIETLLRLHPDVRDAVVIPREDMPGDLRLVAYIVPADRETVQIRIIRHHLIEKLPAYMVPSAFVLLESLPVTPNAKVDRKALPVPDQRACESDRHHIPPRTPLERQLAMLWEKVLGIHAVGISDNFFELGGHSLLAVRLIAEIKKVTGRDLPVITLFQYPTISLFIEMFMQENLLSHTSTLFPIQGAGTTSPFIWIYGSDSNALLPRYLGSDKLIYGIMHQGTDGMRIPHSIEEIAASHIQDIRRVQPKGPYALGGNCFGGLIALEIAHQLLREGEQITLLFLIELPLEHIPSCNTAANQVQTPQAIKSGILNNHDKPQYRGRSGGTTGVLKTMVQNVRRRVNRLRGIMQKTGKLAVCNANLIIKRPLPLDLRNFYRMHMYDNATSQYTLRMYPGPAVIIWADSTPHWLRSEGQRCAASVEMHTVEGSSHITILREPYIGIWAKLLQSKLELALSKGKDKPHEDTMRLVRN